MSIFEQPSRGPLFDQYMADLKERGHAPTEPQNGGVRIADFFGIIREMSRNFRPAIRNPNKLQE